MPLGASCFEDVSLMEFIYHLSIRMPDEGYRMRFRSILLCPFVGRALLIPFVCCVQSPMQGPRRGVLRTQKLKSHLVRTLSLNVLPLKLE